VPAHEQAVFAPVADRPGHFQVLLEKGAYLSDICHKICHPSPLHQQVDQGCLLFEGQFFFGFEKVVGGLIGMVGFLQAELVLGLLAGLGQVVNGLV
jgi:hypothetical protein